MSLSPEGLLGQLDDVGGGLDVDVVVMQGGWVSGGASLCQKNPQPATHLLRGGGLEEKNRGTGIQSISCYMTLTVMCIETAVNSMLALKMEKMKPEIISIAACCSFLYTLV